MKIVIITHSSTYEPRAEAVGSYFAEKGNEVIWICSDFDHHSLQTVSRREPSHIFLHMVPYRKNLSIRRMASIRKFAQDAEAAIRELKPDLLYCLIPANSFAPAAKRLHKAYGTRIIFDIIDLWPESLPVRGIDRIPVIRQWKKLRDSHLDCAELIFTECGLYQRFLPADPAKMHTLYWYKDIPEKLPEGEKVISGAADGLAAADGPLSIAYMGAINHIVDIERIAALVRELNRLTPVRMHIVGKGQNAERFVEAVRQVCPDTIYHGAVYDEQEKRKILGECRFGLNLMKKQVTVGLTMKSVDYLYAGLPLINNIAGDTWQLVREHGIGVNIAGEDMKAEAANILAWADRNPGEEVRGRARDVFIRYFTKDSFYATLDTVLQSEDWMTE